MKNLRPENHKRLGEGICVHQAVCVCIGFDRYAILRQGTQVVDSPASLRKRVARELVAVATHYV